MRIAIFNNTRAGKHHGCDLVMLELERRLKELGGEIAWRSRVGEDWRERADLPRAGDIDAVVLNGEGSIHRAQERPRARYLPKVGPFARTLGVPAFLINATISAIDEEAASDIAAFDLVSVRESESAATLAGYGIESVLVPDLTVAAAYEGDAAVRSGVCATDSVLAPVSACIAARAEREGWPYRSMVWRDQFAPKAAVSDGERRKLLATFVRFLRMHALAVSGRFHTVTMCVATRTPFVAVESNTGKISAFVRDVFGSTERVVPLQQIESGDLSRFAAWSPSEMAALEKYLPQARANTDALFSEIGRRMMAARP